MADEPDNDTTEKPEDAAPAAPEAEGDAGVQPTDAAEPTAADTSGAPAPEEPQANAPEPEASEPAASEAPVAEAASAAEDVPASEPIVQLPPKERRRKARSQHAGETRAARSPEERHAERVAERHRKAVRRRARRLQERAKATERRASAPAAEPLAPVHAQVEGTRRVRQGIVVSDKAEKTITVRIDIARRHRRYEKIVRSSSTLHAHDENNDAHEGDVVRVIESRPLSRTKRWALVDVLERAR
jgi:small subunit ribosomal protein S17